MDPYILMDVILIVCRLAHCGWLLAYNANLSTPRNGWREERRGDKRMVNLFGRCKPKMKLVD
jgi:hypothetical protein